MIMQTNNKSSGLFWALPKYTKFDLLFDMQNEVPSYLLIKTR